MTIKGILLAAAIIGAALLFMNHSEKAPARDTGTNSVTAPRAPYPCESERSAQCTWEQYRQIAEEDCAKYRARGGECKIVTDGRTPHAVHIPSDNERADMRRKIDEGIRHLCDNLSNAGYECRTNNN